MKTIPLIIIGCGGVGRQLIEHIVNTRPLHSAQGVHIRVLGVCDSQSLVISANPQGGELRDDCLSKICHLKSSGSNLSLLDSSNIDQCTVVVSPHISEKLLESAKTFGISTGLVFVDCTASNHTVELLIKALNFGCCAVLANKKPLTSKIEAYDSLVSNWRCIRFESTVGAGLPVIISLNRIIASGDPVQCIMGALSGTLGYVMSELEEGQPFSKVVRLAKELGYTEPDPRDDLSGMDVARKGLILGRLLGWRIELKDIEVESLYPPEMGPDAMSVEDFLMNGLPRLDKVMEEKIRNAGSKGNVVRYVCKVENSSCKVGLLEVPASSPVGQLKGSESLVEVYSRCYKSSPLVIRGAGAGNDTTAAGVLADIVDLQDLFHQ
eukprot:TRINITY_DN21193_c0_g1_i2.p1 TRINITY_DN21193_c0_g1~~TRINITY_DN21193_c0_g1_i2.p1  ORF type:complete len:380 (+),score=69.89 TRINITY_DN21193_c0_g1_i2:305-1444(+)